MTPLTRYVDTFSGIEKNIKRCPPETTLFQLTTLSNALALAMENVMSRRCQTTYFEARMIIGLSAKVNNLSVQLFRAPQLGFYRANQLFTAPHSRL